MHPRYLAWATYRRATSEDACGSIGFYGYAYQHHFDEKLERKKNFWNYVFQAATALATILFGATTFYYQQLNASHQAELEVAKVQVTQLQNTIDNQQKQISRLKSQQMLLPAPRKPANR